MSSTFATRVNRSAFSTVESALAAIFEGIPVIVVDAEDRENEGDFVVAAEKMTAEGAHLLMSVGRGQMCISVAPTIAARLRIERIPCSHDDEDGPAFAVPIDHRSCDTGVSPR